MRFPPSSRANDLYANPAWKANPSLPRLTANFHYRALTIPLSEQQIRAKINNFAQTVNIVENHIMLTEREKQSRFDNFKDTYLSLTFALINRCFIQILKNIFF